jgi:hypothetical protein
MMEDGYPYLELNLWRGKLHEQGTFRTKAEAIRRAKRDAERTHVMNERFSAPGEERSELFIVVDTRTGEVIGGRMIVDADRESTDGCELHKEDPYWACFDCNPGLRESDL